MNINQIGKYLYEHLDGAYDYKKSANTFDIFLDVYYQIPQLSIDPSSPTTYSDIQSMKFNINLTTYQNKVRMNLIEIDPNDRPLLYKLYDTNKLKSVKSIYEKALEDIQKTLNKYYEGYEFIF